MNVLSLFDGMSCGRVALERCGFKINKYYAAEIDKYAITVAANNYLDTIHVGDVTKVDGTLYKGFDLLIGGSPCQGFSFAGKQLNFEDPRSKLFFEFVRLKNEMQPKYFFLENVVMKQEFQDAISSYLGVQPIKLNSALVSAQSRKRLYWTNIPGYTEPEDKGILLQDIIEDGLVDRDKSYCIDAHYFKGGNMEQYFNKARRQLVFKTKAGTLEATYYKENVKSLLKRHKLGQMVSDGIYARKLTPIECERLQTLPDNYTIGLSNSQRYKMLGNGWTVDAICEFFKHIPKDIDLF